MELALITPVMVLLVFGVLDLARGYRMQIQLENAAREGAAFAQVHPNDVTCGPNGNIRDRAAREDDGLSSLPEFRVTVLGEGADGALTVPITTCGGTTAGPRERVRVTVTARYDIVTPIVANVVGNSVDISGTAEVRVQG